MRIDLLLVQWGLAPSRSKAQELIRNSEVEVKHGERWDVVHLPSQRMERMDRENVRLRSSEILKFVSRGGLKLEAALEHVHFDVAGAIALDVGISTGGFADCLLQRGAARIIGVDVGVGQLAKKLTLDRRVTHFEKLNAREIHRHRELLPAVRDVNLCVIDVSFISLELIIPEIAKMLGAHRLLALIKPQFELSADELNKNGIVKSPSGLERAQQRVRATATASGYTIEAVFPCDLKGGDGNQEFFLWATRDLVNSSK